MNIGIAFFKMQSSAPVTAFAGFALAGFASAKTDTNQILVASVTATAGVPNITVYFSGEPYYLVAPNRANNIAYESVNKVFVIGSGAQTGTPYSTNGGSTWNTSISHPFGTIAGITAGKVTALLDNGFLVYGSNGGSDSTDLIRSARSSSMSSGWSVVVHPTMHTIVGAATNGSGYWVVTGTRGTGTNSDILWSTDGGANFNDISVSAPTFSTSGRAVAYGEWHTGISHAPAWVVGGIDGSSNTLLFTFQTDGSSGWTVEVSLAISIIAIATDGAAKWVAVGTGSQEVYYSGDYGASWALANLNIGADTYLGQSVAYGNFNGTPTWMLTGTSSGSTKTLYSTTNGSSWHAPNFVAPAEEFAGPGVAGGQAVIFV